MKPAPVVLFVYNRPEHTRRTLIALKENELASVSELFVFADGPKATATKADIEDIDMTRAIVREQNWCKQVTIIEREKNFGLAANITGGVTSIVNKYGRVIVLEDDIVTAPTFLTYMNNSLDLYANDDKVMHIAGYTFPWIDAKTLVKESYFYRVPSCWGWATWDRSWKYYKDDAVELFVDLCDRGELRRFDLDYSGAFIGQLNANIVGNMRSWAVKWYASVAIERGLALHPTVSLVNNSGFDGTGVNSAETTLFEHQALGTLTTPKRQPLEEDTYVSGSMIKRYRNTWAIRTKIFFANRVKNYFKLKFLKARK